MKAGEAFLFEDNKAIRGKILTLYNRRYRTGNSIVKNQTNGYRQMSVQAPEGWNVFLKEMQEQVHFDASAKAHPELAGKVLQVDMGGRAEITKQGVTNSRYVLEVSVPQDALPGRYWIKAVYKHQSSKYDSTIEFIVEVL